MSERATRLRRVTLGLALGLNSCVPHVDEQVVQTPHPSTTESAHRIKERQQALPDFHFSVSGDILSIRSEQRTECRTQITAPMEEDTETRRTLQGGFWAQTGNVVGAAALAVAGVAVYANAASASCSMTPPASTANPNPMAMPCTPDQQQQQTAQTRGIGAILAGCAIIPLGAFVWNLVRAHDDKETRTLPTKTTTSEWETCGTKPLSNARLTLTLAAASRDGAETVLSTTTDGEGGAQFDLSDARSLSDEARLSSITAEGLHSSERVSLTGTPMRAASDAAASHEVRVRIDQEELNKQDTALDGIEPDFAALERTPEPWGDSELEKARKCLAVVFEFKNRHADKPLEPRLARDINRYIALDPKIHRAKELAAQRAQQEKLDQQKRDAEAQRQLLPACIQCCLTSFVGATRDHCEAACGDNPRRYVDFEGGSPAEAAKWVRENPGASLFYCK